MSTYVALANYTDKGMQNIRDSPRRLDTVRQHLREMGGDIVSFYLTLGEHDIVFVYEAPDDAISARFLLLLGAAGFVRTKTMKAFPEAAYREIITSLG
jgi:uncharacterized protein with GYD domain